MNSLSARDGLNRGQLMFEEQERFLLGVANGVGMSVCFFWIPLIWWVIT